MASEGRDAISLGAKSRQVDHHYARVGFLKLCAVVIRLVSPCGTGAWRTSTRNTETRVTAVTVTHKLSFSSAPGVW